MEHNESNELKDWTIEQRKIWWIMINTWPMSWGVNNSWLHFTRIGWIVPLSSKILWISMIIGTDIRIGWRSLLLLLLQLLMLMLMLLLKLMLIRIRIRGGKSVVRNSSDLIGRGYHLINRWYIIPIWWVDFHPWNKVKYLNKLPGKKEIKHAFEMERIKFPRDTEGDNLISKEKIRKQDQLLTYSKQILRDFCQSKS